MAQTDVQTPTLTHSVLHKPLCKQCVTLTPQPNRHSHVGSGGTEPSCICPPSQQAGVLLQPLRPSPQPCAALRFKAVSREGGRGGSKKHRAQPATLYFSLLPVCFARPELEVGGRTEHPHLTSPAQLPQYPSRSSCRGVGAVRQGRGWVASSQPYPQRAKN